jgi:small subunit ribosomal protein S21
MLIIDVKREGGIEKALKTYKRKYTKVGIVKELREREEFTKPCVRRRSTVKKAVYLEKLRAAEMKD